MEDYDAVFFWPSAIMLTQSPLRRNTKTADKVVMEMGEMSRTIAPRCRCWCVGVGSEAAYLLIKLVASCYNGDGHSVLQLCGQWDQSRLAFARIPSFNAWYVIPNSSAWPGIPNFNAWPGIPSSNAWPGIPTYNASPGIPSSNAWPGITSSNAWPGIPSSNAWSGIPSSNAWPRQWLPLTYRHNKLVNVSNSIITNSAHSFEN